MSAHTAARGAAPACAAALLLVLARLASSPAPSAACSTFLVGRGASSDGSLFVTHSDDGEGNPDVRLSYVPAADHQPGSARAVWPDLEDNPRYVGYARGDTYRPSHVPPQPLTEPIGSVAQVNHTFAYTEGNYGIMNERQLSIGESTCSGAFVAKAAGSGGQALFCVNELSRLAMERCATARCAVELMGGMAERFGFYGASGEGGGKQIWLSTRTRMKTAVTSKRSFPFLTADGAHTTAFPKEQVTRSRG